ncbi:hypothetical protein MTO96_048549 [Rhipicephalus appendiculatus]
MQILATEARALRCATKHVDGGSGGEAGHETAKATEEEDESSRRISYGNARFPSACCLRQLLRRRYTRQARSADVDLGTGNASGQRFAKKRHAAAAWKSRTVARIRCGSHTDGTPRMGGMPERPILKMS